MTLIDQRILIDAPIDVVWKMLIDPRELRGWHAGYTSVSILTTHERGEGVRRRCGLTETGKDVFEEITAWVEGLGYEYRVLEGGPYRRLTGVFRLQAIPDGVSVQWVITYQPKGLVGVLKDRMGGRRKMAAMMAESLRELRRRINVMGVRMDDSYRERVGIRGRLDANERAQYQRRYTSGDEAAEPETAPGVVATPAAPVPVATVPSFVADLTSDETDLGDAADTRPRKPDGLDEAIALYDASETSGPVSGSVPGPVPGPVIEAPANVTGAAGVPLREPPLSDDDTPPHGTTAARVPAGAPLPYSSSAGDFAPPGGPAIIEDDETETPFHQQITPPRGMPAVRLPDEVAAPPALGAAPVGSLAGGASGATDAPELAPVPLPSEIAPPPPVSATPPPEPPRERVVPPPAELAPVRRSADLPPQTPKHDTGEMSIWEVFGVQRPSEQDTAALNSLIRSAAVRERAGLGLAGMVRGVRRVFKRPARVRAAAPSLVGLRLRLALRRARVRLFWRGRG